MAERRRIKREETKADQTHRQQKPQEEKKHPETYQRDLNPDWMKGQNIGQRAEEVEPGTRRASELKDVVAHLQDFTLEELREIPVLPPGARLEQGATYVNLRDPAREPFTATGDMRSGTDDWLVPKNEVAHPYWNRLIRAAPGHRRT